MAFLASPTWDMEVPEPQVHSRYSAEATLFARTAGALRASYWSWELQEPSQNPGSLTPARGHPSKQAVQKTVVEPAVLECFSVLGVSPRGGSVLITLSACLPGPPMGPGVG